MWRVFGVVVSGIAAVGGVCGLLRPELYRTSLEEAYTARGARISGAVLLLLGLAGLYAMLIYGANPTDFFPA
jgi:hypothetical protein